MSISHAVMCGKRRVHTAVAETLLLCVLTLKCFHKTSRKISHQNRPSRLTKALQLPCFTMAFRRAAGSLALRFARSSRSFTTVAKSVAAAVETPVCSVAKPHVHLSRCFSAAAEPAPAPSAVKGYVTQVKSSVIDFVNIQQIQQRDFSHSTIVTRCHNLAQYVCRIFPGHRSCC